MTRGAGKETNASSRPPLTDEERWRLECFVELGFMADDALVLACAKVDHWIVSRALEKGCTHAQAVRIFT